MAWLKPYINMNTDFRKAAKMILKKTFVSWWIVQFLEKIWKNIYKYRDIKLRNNRKKKKLFCFRNKLSYYKVFHRKFAGYRNEKKSNTHA